VRLLGIDHGRARLGVALSDESELLATPLTTLDATRLEPLLARLRDLIHAHCPGALVIGLPLNADGTEGPQARQVRKFAQKLQPLGLPIHLQNEHLSTHEAYARGATDKTRDQVAAALILQAYLDERRNPRS
jgi:putative Holliday junction resolvase